MRSGSKAKLAIKTMRSIKQLIRRRIGPEEFFKFYKPWLKVKELSHLVRDILRFIANAEDVEERACIFKRNNAQLVLFLLRK